jgi:inorganic pyrophosphatase
MHALLVVVETPKGSTEKYDWNPREKMFELNKILPVGMVFPFDFGFIPETKGEDGDPLDALIFSEFKSFPGCRMHGRLIGAITGRQKEGKGDWIRNDRFLFVPSPSVVYSEINKVQDLSKKLLRGVLTFLMTYNEQKEYEVIKIISRERAWQLIKAGHDA